MKKISAVFDGLKFADNTLAYAIKLAESSKALLSGIFLESFLYNSYTLTDLIGKHGVSQVKMKHLLEKDKETRLKSASTFEQACKKAHLNYTLHHDPGLAIPEALKESIYSDLLLISSGETFSHLPGQSPTYFIRELLAGAQCPVLIVPREYREIEKVMLLYDGKPAAVYAIKMFNYMMPWLRSKTTEVVSVTAISDTAELPDEVLVKEFITCHYPAASYTLLTGNPEDELLTYLKGNNKNSLVVLGAYQRGGVSRWFKSSMADHLMKAIDAPLFIAHH
ncbi:universal stress protein [Mucilaginibacter sp. UR6-11]|uniref:universal stress protein n=1 Tax=Mucilaginibacter sp. UR6-11 TaxID=1435644 RepID=UPI001E4D6F3C|nr:universal stress protein [Mucilaginibacter sp. UR6-11]MCC8426500.1 universal stress protein [Mucilaginibacter sp. UR6-11]